jgi:hypothetical protein
VVRLLNVFYPGEERFLATFPTPLLDELRSLVDYRAIPRPARGEMQDPTYLAELYQAEILLTGWGTPLLPTDLAQRGKLKYICHVTGGVRGMIPRELFEQGVLVTNWGSAISRTVAEASLMMILACLRRVRPIQEELHNRGGYRSVPQPGSLFERPVAGIAAGAVCILLVAELGWGVLQRRSWRQSLKVPLEITFGTATASITALLDTGNQLKCPLSGVPVIVVEHRMLAEIFPPSLLVAIERLGEGDLSTLSSQISSTPWSSRFRIIPYTSIGASNGLMIGFRPTAVSLWLSGQVYVAPTCIIALSPQTLDPNGAYHALIGLDLVEGHATEQESSRSGSELGSTYTHGCPNLEVATRHQMGK